MFYGKNVVEENFDVLLRKLEQVQELFLFEPMPDYKLHDRWTDEFRIRDGHTKLADGTWVTIRKVNTWVEKLKKDTVDLYEQYQQTTRELTLAKRRIFEMEFGLRTAQKSFNKSLQMKGDSDE